MNPELDFEKRYRLLREVIETAVLTVLMFLVIRLAVQNFNVDGMSMEPNLHNQELILVDKWSYMFREPTRGDVIVFIAPPQPTVDYVKRIIGLPGDIVTVDGTTVIVNGKVLKEFYIDPRLQGNFNRPIINAVVPPDTYFVLGDNRFISSDSRVWGCLPRKNIIGRASLIYWPLGRDNNGLLPDVTAAYNSIPQQPTGHPMSACHVINNPTVATVSSHTVLNRTASSGTAPTGAVPDVNMFLILVMPGMYLVCTRRKEVAKR